MDSFVRPLAGWLGGAAVVVGAALSVHPSLAAGDAPDPTVEAFQSGDCARCHDVPNVPPAARLDSCEGCHTWIKAVSADPAKRAKAMSVFPLWERYEKNVASYLEVPRITAAMARLDPEWVRRYLKDPYDLRPNLPETMPRFALPDAQVDLIVATFAKGQAKVAKSPAPSQDRVARGEQVFAEKACGSCHDFGGRWTKGTLAMAPDLAHARERMDADHLYAWIRDPKSLSPDATMPTLGLSADDALAVRDYVLLADPEWTPAPALGAAPAALTTPVTYEMVEDRVTGKICRHCHMNPDKEQGRAGPGNAGGFGWPRTGIELEDYEGVAAAADKIPDALLRRRDEAHRDFVHAGQQPADLTRPPVPGMPLGLPPLSDEDIALVLGWIAQGKPR